MRADPLVMDRFPHHDADVRTFQLPDLDAETAMWSLAQPERVTGSARTTLSQLLAGRYEHGATLVELAEMIGRSQWYVRSLLVEAGVTIRRPGERRRHRDSATDAVGAVQQSAGQAIEESAVPGYTAWRASRGPRVEATNFTGWQRPEPMVRVQPEELDWSWQQALVYDVELVVELYVQGRSYDEVATVTGYPADKVRAWVLAAGVARPRRIEVVVAAWRAASRERLRKVDRLDLVSAWVDGIEVEDLAAAHQVPADMLWDVIADQFARIDKRHTLAVRPLGRRLAPGPRCVGGVCLYACSRTCASLVPPAEPDGAAASKALNRSWPPPARLSRDVAVSDRGRVVWSRSNAPPG